VTLAVFERSDSTVALVDEIERRWGTMESQVKESDLADVPVLASRPLKRDPSYVPAYRPAPVAHSLEVTLTDEACGLLDGLVATGVYGETRGEAVRAAFMRWSNTHITRVRRAKVAFT
jgi:hypothetical protein